MSHIVLIAIISGAFTLSGTALGIISLARMVNYRIEHLEKKII